MMETHRKRWKWPIPEEIYEMRTEQYSVILRGGLCPAGCWINKKALREFNTYCASCDHVYPSHKIGLVYQSEWSW